MADMRTPDYQSFLYAYALGCLDKDDFIQLVEHLESGESFSWQELGEFQNLAALLPSFLRLEEPDVKVKDRVARKLYRLKDEKRPAAQQPPPASIPGNPFARTQTTYHKKMKTQIIEAPPKAVTQPERTAIPDDEIQVPQEFKPQGSISQRSAEGQRPQQDTQIRNRSQQEVPDRPDQQEERTEFSDFGKLHMPDMPEEETQQNEEEFIINQAGYGDTSESADTPNIPAPPAAESAKTASSPGSPDLEAIRRQVVENVSRQEFAPVEPIEIKAGISPVIFSITVLLLVAGMAGLYYYLSPRFTKQQAEVNKLRDEFTTKVAEVNRNSEVMILLASKGSYAITLHGSNRYPEAYGQFIYNRENKRGILMIANLPASAPEMGYQLWYEIKDKKIPVGMPLEFGTGGLKIEYFNFPTVPSFPAGEKALLYMTAEKLKQTPLLPTKEKFIEIEAILN